MSYRNPLMTELMIPRDPEVAARLNGFYEEIGWSALADSNDRFTTYVHPIMPNEPPLAIPPTIAYWKTQNRDKTGEFVEHEAGTPSPYARGLRLPRMQQLVEVCLIVPSDDTVHDIFALGGSMLAAHAHIPPREYAGRQEFRFSDPFNYSLRVTANPGWEIRPQISTRAEDALLLPLSHRFVFLGDRHSERQIVDVITPENLRNAAQRFYGKTYTGELLKRIFDPERREVFANFMHFDKEGNPDGILKGKLGHLIIYMHHEGLFKSIRGLGTGAKDLLHDLYNYLFPGDPLDLE